LHIAASLENKTKDKLCGDTDKKDIKQYIWFIISGYKSVYNWTSNEKKKKYFGRQYNSQKEKVQTANTTPL
jgi:hypothetical protein